ncbi:sulfurtransferase, partial [Vibrio vulnificus]
CGSGVTACILLLGAYLIGYKNLSVYDGSWTEWGANPQLPIEP